MTKELTPEHTIEMLQRERDSLRDRVEGLRWMVDQMNKDSEAIIYDSENHGSVYAAIAYTWGPKCDVYEPGCPRCAAWEEYDGSTALRADNERLRAALKPILNYPNIREKIGNQLYGLGCAALEAKRISEADGQPAPGKEEV